MAALEKVCEFSGEYPSYAMYHTKRNHIQVMPKYRKEFRGKMATMYVFKSSDIVTDGVAFWDADYDCINPNPTEDDWNSNKPDCLGEYVNGRKNTYAVFYENVEQYKQALKSKHQRLCTEYVFVLHVPDVPGNVGGCYVNWSHDISSTIRRMVGSRNLTVKYKDGGDSELLVFMDSKLRK